MCFIYSYLVIPQGYITNSQFDTEYDQLPVGLIAELGVLFNPAFFSQLLKLRKQLRGSCFHLIFHPQVKYMFHLLIFN